MEFTNFDYYNYSNWISLYSIKIFSFNFGFAALLKSLNHSFFYQLSFISSLQSFMDEVSLKIVVIVKLRKIVYHVFLLSIHHLIASHLHFDRNKNEILASFVLLAIYSLRLLNLLQIKVCHYSNIQMSFFYEFCL